MLLNWEDLLLNPAPVTSAAAAPNPWAASIVPAASLAPAPQPTPQPQNPGSAMPDWMGSPAISPRVTASIPAMQANYDPFKAFAPPQKAAPKRGVLGESFGTLNEAEQKKWLEDQFAAYETGMRRIKGLEAQMANAPSPYARRGLDAILKSELAALPDINKLNEMRDGFAPLPTKTGTRTAVENVAKGFTDSLLSVPEFAGIVKGYLKPGQVDDDSLLQWSQGAKKRVEELFPGDAARQNDFSQQLATGLGQIASFYGTGALTALAKAGPKVIAAVVATQGASQTGAQGFTEATQKLQAARREALTTGDMGTVTELDRLLQTAGYAAVGTTEAIPVASTFGRMVDDTTGRLAQRAVGAAEGAVEESLQEAGSQFLQNAIAGQTTDPQRGLGEGVAESAAVGGVLGAGAGGLLTKTQQPVQQITPEVEAPFVYEGQPGEPLSFIDLVPGEGYTEVRETAQLAAPQKALPSPEEPGSAAAGAMPAPQPNAPEGGAPAALEDVDASFAGKRATTANQSALSKAQQLTDRGATPEQVWSQTGWYVGNDGQWRWEIDDSQARFKIPVEAQRNWIGLKNKDEVKSKSSEGVLGDFLHHPQLFSAYPKLKNVQLRINIGSAYPYIEGGAGRGKIILTAPNTEQALTLLLHEIQHWTQEEEGFAPGTSKARREETNKILASDAAMQHHRLTQQGRTEEAAALADKIQQIKNAEATFQQEEPSNLAYRSSQGETEARNTAGRRKLTAAQRTMSFPETTADVSRADTIGPDEAVIFDKEGRPRALSMEGVQRSNISTRDSVRDVSYDFEISSPALQKVADKLINILKPYIKGSGINAHNLIETSEEHRFTDKEAGFVKTLPPILQLAIERLRTANRNLYSSGNLTGVAQEIDDLLTDKGPDASARPGADAPRVTPSATLKPELLNKQADALIKSGRATQLPEALTAPVYSMLEANKELTNGLPTFVLERLEPAGVSESGKPQVRAVFRSPEGEETDFLTPQQDLFNLRAFHSGGRLFFLSLNAAETGSQGLTGKLWHEVLHALRRQGNLPGGDFDRLLGHANDLNIAGMDYHEFARRTSDPSWADYPTGVTIRELYADLYQGKEDILERLNQEAVAHMLELYNAGALDAAQFEPIQDVLDNMAAGRYAGPGAQATGGPDYGWNPFKSGKSEAPTSLDVAEPAFEASDELKKIEKNVKAAQEQVATGGTGPGSVYGALEFLATDPAAQNAAKNKLSTLLKAMKVAYPGVGGSGMTASKEFKQAFKDLLHNSANHPIMKEAAKTIDNTGPSLAMLQMLNNSKVGLGNAAKQVYASPFDDDGGSVQTFYGAKKPTKLEPQSFKDIGAAYQFAEAQGIGAIFDALYELAMDKSSLGDEAGLISALIKEVEQEVEKNTNADTVAKLQVLGEGLEYVKAGVTPKAPNIKKTSAAVKKEAASTPPKYPTLTDAMKDANKMGGPVGDKVISAFANTWLSANDALGLPGTYIDTPEVAAKVVELILGDVPHNMDPEVQGVLNQLAYGLGGKPVAPDKPKTPYELVHEFHDSLPSSWAQNLLKDVSAKLEKHSGLDIGYPSIFNNHPDVQAFLSDLAADFKQALHKAAEEGLYTVGGDLHSKLLTAQKKFAEAVYGKEGVNKPIPSKPEQTPGDLINAAWNALPNDKAKAEFEDILKKVENATNISVTAALFDTLEETPAFMTMLTGSLKNAAQGYKDTLNDALGSALLRVAKILEGGAGKAEAKPATTKPKAPEPKLPSVVVQDAFDAVKTSKAKDAFYKLMNLHGIYPNSAMFNQVTTAEHLAPLIQDLKNAFGLAADEKKQFENATGILERGLAAWASDESGDAEALDADVPEPKGISLTEAQEMADNYMVPENGSNIGWAIHKAIAQTSGSGEDVAEWLKKTANSGMYVESASAGMLQIANALLGVDSRSTPAASKALSQGEIAQKFHKAVKAYHHTTAVKMIAALQDDWATLEDLAQNLQNVANGYSDGSPISQDLNELAKQVVGWKAETAAPVKGFSSLQALQDAANDVNWKVGKAIEKATTQAWDTNDELATLIKAQYKPGVDGTDFLTKLTEFADKVSASKEFFATPNNPFMGKTIQEMWEALGDTPLAVGFNNYWTQAYNENGQGPTAETPAIALALTGKIEAHLLPTVNEKDAAILKQVVEALEKQVGGSSPAATPKAPAAPAHQKAPWPDHFTTIVKANDFVSEYLPESSQAAWAKTLQDTIDSHGSGGLDNPKGKNALAKALEATAFALVNPPKSEKPEYPTTFKGIVTLANKHGALEHVNTVLQKIQEEAEEDGNTFPPLDSPEWKAVMAEGIGDYIDAYWGDDIPEDRDDQQAVKLLEQIANGLKGAEFTKNDGVVNDEDKLAAKHLSSLAKRLKNDDESFEPFAIKLPGLTFEDLVPAPTDKNFTFAKNAGGGTKPKEIWKDDEGNEYLFKPVKESDSFIAYGEALGGHISQLVNPQAPRIWVHKLNGRLGSMQQMLPTKGGILGIPVHELSEADIDAIQREHVVDWLISNHDGHANQFIRVEGGALVGIDKGQAFKYFGKDRLDTDYHPNAQYGEREPIYNELWRAFKEGKLGAYSKAKFGEEGEEIDRLKKAIPTVEADFKKANEARVANEQANIAERVALQEARTAVFYGTDEAAIYNGTATPAIDKLFPKGGQGFDTAWEKIVAAAGGLDNVDTTTKALAAMPELVALSEVSLKAMMKGLLEAGKVLPKAAKADLKTLGKLAEVYWEAVKSGNTRAEAWTKTTIAMEGKPGDPQLFPNDYYGHGKEGFRKYLEAAIGAPMHAAADIKDYPHDDHGGSLWKAARKRLQAAAFNNVTGILGILRNKHSEFEKEKVELTAKEAELANNLTLLRDQLSGLQHTIGENIFLPANEAITLLQEKLSDDQFLAMIRPYAEARFKNRPAGFNAFMDYALQRKQNLANKFNRFFIELTEARARAKSAMSKFGHTFESLDRTKAEGSQEEYEPAKALSILELAAIKKYTGSLYSDVNAYLRDPAPIIENGKVKTKWIQAAEVASLIDSGLRKLPPYVGTALRGQNTYGAEREEMRPGKIFTTKPLWSASTTNGFSNRNTKFILESKTGRYLEPITEAKGEYEVLFPTNCQFLITHVEKKKENYEEILYVHATELPDIDFNDL